MAGASPYPFRDHRTVAEWKEPNSSGRPATAGIEDASAADSARLPEHGARVASPSQTQASAADAPEQNSSGAVVVGTFPAEEASAVGGATALSTPAADAKWKDCHPTGSGQREIASFTPGAFAEGGGRCAVVTYAHGLIYLSLADAEKIAAELATACAILRRAHPAQVQTWPVETR